ncbi:MAG: DUF3267 domain-containing protein [Chloroflexota bacterium]|nr:DUF3267 domain-containing protein [Chloroflexota bacterium]
MTDSAGKLNVREWHPGALELAIWNVTALALFVFFLGIYSNISASDSTLTIGLGDLVAALLAVNALMIAHEFVHGLVIQRYGGTPKYGLKMIARVVPVAWCTSPGTRFTRAQFLLVSLAPFVVISIAGAVITGAAPGRSAFPLAFAVHAAGCIGDLWVVGVAFRQPAGTMFEDRKSGLRFHPGVASANETGTA